jgi:hypothetical protein
VRPVFFLRAGSREGTLGGLGQKEFANGVGATSAAFAGDAQRWLTLETNSEPEAFEKQPTVTA